MADSKRAWSPPQIIWSALIAVVLWTAAGFNWFGPGFNWTTQGDSRQMTVDALMENRAAICVAQATKDSDSAMMLQQFAEAKSWEQREFVEDARWAIMPGADQAESGVAALCAKKLRNA